MQDGLSHSRRSPLPVSELPMGAVPRLNVGDAFDRCKICVRERPLSDEQRAHVQLHLRPRGGLSTSMGGDGVKSPVDGGGGGNFGGDRLIAFHPNATEGLVYRYDYFLPEESTQADAHAAMGEDIVDLIVGGFSANLITIGPSGGGKTHTMFGSDHEPGLVQTIVKGVFERLIEGAQATPMETATSFRCEVRYWEMSADSMIDVLVGDNDTKTRPPNESEAASNARRGLRLRRDEDGVVSVAGLVSRKVETYEEFDLALSEGNIRRVELARRRGARWHGFIQLHVTTSRTAEPTHEVVRRLTFAHLKGAERVGLRDVRDRSFRELGHINKSLSLFTSALLHAIEFRRKALKDVGNAEGHWEVIRKSRSFFAECRLTEMLAPLVCGTEAAFVVGAIAATDFGAATDCLEVLQSLQQLTAMVRRTVRRTTLGEMQREVERVERAVKSSTDRGVGVAEGRPLTDVEARVEAMKAAYAEAVAQAAAGVPVSAALPPARPCDDPRGFVDRLRTARANVRPIEIPEGAKVWQKSALKAKIHGDRVWIHLPTAGPTAHGFTGQWREGLRDGYGRHDTPHAIYEGEWKRGQREGHGTLWVRPKAKPPSAGSLGTLASGTAMKSATKGGTATVVSRHGASTQRKALPPIDGGEAPWVCVYRGEWRAGLREGRGVEHNPKTGEAYDGLFVAGERSTLGRLSLPNGDLIEGQFVHGVVHGWATLLRTNGDRYDGHWANGLRDGHGSFVFAERQQMLEGEWFKGVCRTGVYVDLDTKQSAIESGGAFFPRVGLVDPDGVVNARVAEIDAARKEAGGASATTPTPSPPRGSPSPWAQKETQGQDESVAEQVTWQ